MSKQEHSLGHLVCARYKGSRVPNSQSSMHITLLSRASASPLLGSFLFSLLPKCSLFAQRDIRGNKKASRAWFYLSRATPFATCWLCDQGPGSSRTRLLHGAVILPPSSRGRPRLLRVDLQPQSSRTTGEIPPAANGARGQHAGGDTADLAGRRGLVATYLCGSRALGQGASARRLWRNREHADSDPYGTLHP